MSDIRFNTNDNVHFRQPTEQTTEAKKTDIPLNQQTAKRVPLPSSPAIHPNKTYDIKSTNDGNISHLVSRVVTKAGSEKVATFAKDHLTEATTSTTQKKRAYTNTPPTNPLVSQAASRVMAPAA
jgi:hypothetical protein